jgi:drug/metabolite transporter, DME family
VSAPRRAIIAVVGAAMLFGTAGTAQELGPEGATPLGVGAARILVGTVVLWGAVLWSSTSASQVRTVARLHRRLVVVGGLGVAVYTPAFLAAVERAGVAVGTVVAIGSGPFFAATFEWMWRRVRTNREWLIGTVATVAGGAVLVWSQADDALGGVDAVGVVLALAAGAGYAMYSVTSKTVMSSGVPSTLALALPFTVGVVVVAVASVGQPFEWVTTGEGLLMALHLGVAATGVAYLLFGYGLRRLTAATTVTLVLAEPLTAALLATVLLDQSIGPVGWIGVAVVLVGLVVVGRSATAGERVAGTASLR